MPTRVVFVCLYGQFCRSRYHVDYCPVESFYVLFEQFIAVLIPDVPVFKAWWAVNCTIMPAKYDSMKS